MAEPVVDSTETYKTANEGASKESVSVEQGQLLRAVELGKGVLKVKTLRHRITLEFTHSNMLYSKKSAVSVYGKVTDDLQDSDPEEASFDRTNIAAMRGPKDVVEYMVRVSCDRLDEWRFGVCSLKWQNETAEITCIDFPTLQHVHRGRTRGLFSTCTQCTDNAEKQTTVFKWISEDNHSEVVKFAELSWFRSIVQQ